MIVPHWNITKGRPDVGPSSCAVSLSRTVVSKMIADVERTLGVLFDRMHPLLSQGWHHDW
jgi:hypothetical protein